MKKLTLTICIAASVVLLGSCGKDSDATVASENISTAADNFEVLRRIVFYNSIIGETMLNIMGFCNIEDDRATRSHKGNRLVPTATGEPQLEVTCEVEDGHKKHFLGISDNVTYFVEHMDASKVSEYHYRMVWKPQAIIPNLDIRGSDESKDVFLIHDDNQGVEKDRK